MKRIFLTLIVFVTVLCYGQDQSLSFFTKKGTVAFYTSMLDTSKHTIVNINHRYDDVIWSKEVYRIVDLRDRQNNQLYYPVMPDGKFRSLFRTILDATIDSVPVPVYEKITRDFRPNYGSQIIPDSMPNLFVLVKIDPTTKALDAPYKILNYEKNKKKLELDTTIESAIEDYSKYEIKFVLHEVVFFDKHYSRMYSKIIGIAPFYAYNENNLTKYRDNTLNKDKDGIWNFFINSVKCWYLYDELRPYLARQYVKPNGNGKSDMTLDQFFIEKMYSSYVLGDDNMFNRVLIQNYNDPEVIHQEQKRIETELLNTEIDLWEN